MKVLHYSRYASMHEIFVGFIMVLQLRYIQHLLNYIYYIIPTERVKSINHFQLPSVNLCLFDVKNKVSIKNS